MDRKDSINPIDKKKEKERKVLEDLAVKMDNMRVAEYLALVTNPKKLIWMNFLLGLARGLGMSIGFTVLLALILYIMRSWVNLPVIGKWIAELIHIIENYR